MPDPLVIHVNSPRPNALEVPEMFVADREFALEIENEGKPVHVHLNLDDDLEEVLELETGNHFVPRENAYRLPVALRDGRRPVRGKLKVSTGYGAESRFIEVRIVEPDPDDQVTVDASLAQPQREATEPAVPAGVLGEVGMIALIGISLVALLVAAVIVGSVTAPVWGALAAVLGLSVVAGIYLFL